MRGKSHQCLGKYLAEQYLEALPKHHIRVFLLGCIQPDRNPATYLKGSLRCQWLRGHNWDNSKKHIARLCRRLERRHRLRLVDCYRMGKLIHYTADAFTAAHNRRFGEDLQRHRLYEQQLQHHFLDYLTRCPAIPGSADAPLMGIIRGCHREYLRLPVSIHSDTFFCVGVSSLVMAGILSKM